MDRYRGIARRPMARTAQLECARFKRLSHDGRKLPNGNQRGNPTDPIRGDTDGVSSQLTRVVVCCNSPKLATFVQSLCPKGRLERSYKQLCDALPYQFEHSLPAPRGELPEAVASLVAKSAALRVAGRWSIIRASVTTHPAGTGRAAPLSLQLLSIRPSDSMIY